MTTLTCDRDAFVYSGSGIGAGGSDYLPVGKSAAGATYRSLVHFPLPSWTDIRRITSAVLRVRNSSQYFITRGATPRILVLRCTQDWYERTVGGLLAVTWASQPTATTLNQADSGTISTVDGTWVDIDVTAMVRAWAPLTVEGGLNQRNYGFRLASYDEASATRTTEFYSRETSVSDALLILTTETNTAPYAPTITSPKTDGDGGAVIAPLTAGAMTIKGARSDSDPGDYLTKVQVQVFFDSITDATAGTPIYDGTFSFTAKQTSFAVVVPKGTLTVGTTYRHRVRTADKQAAWGPWTSLAAGRFIPDTVPGKPINLAVDTGTATPNLYGSLVDADTGATLSSVRIVVFQDIAGGTTVSKWDSGWVTTSGTRFAIAYGGTSLSVGTRYRFAAQVADAQGAQGPLSDFFYWTLAAAVGPDNMTPRSIESKLNGRPVTLTIANSSAFDAHLLEVARYADGSTLLWQPAQATYTSTSSKAVIYAGPIMDWGRTYYWRAKVRVGGVTYTEWSPWYPFYFNAYPDPPVVTIDNGVAAINAAGTPVVAVSTLTPTIRAPFSDPDVLAGYVDVPTRREIAITNAITGLPVTGSPFVITTGITDTFVVPGGAFVWDGQYRVLVRYDDNANVRGAWGRPQPPGVVKPSQPPTVALSAPIDLSTVTDPTPTLDWAFTSPGAKAQKRFRVRVYGDGT